MDEIKYKNLIQILDNLCSEAPSIFKKYHPLASDEQNVSKARSLAYIHLFLKVKYGLTDFNDRESFITEGSQDGGLDAYYIDERNYTIYLIQSKMRNSSDGFRDKTLTGDELIKTEYDRITKGKKDDSRGKDFNSKVKAFQNKVKKLNIGKYVYKVIILGNIKYSKAQVQKNIGRLEYEIFTADNCYNELILPLVSGINFDPEEIMIYINVDGDNEPYLSKPISTSNGLCKTMVVLVPTLEIAKIMSKYKNSILQYNPRNYLSLSQNNVNLQIRKSIIKTTSNDFAVLNNGITMISDNEVRFNHTTHDGIGQIVITNPQIINGGQTAYTLSEVYRLSGPEIFNNKEVLLRIISVSERETSLNDFIQKISVSTNQQSKVSDADRRSNDPIQIDLQKRLYDEFGYYYERKAGEFYTGLNEGYINKDLVIDRIRFIRSYCAFLGNPSDARGNSGDLFFRENKFKKILGQTQNFKEMFFAYYLFLLLVKYSRIASRSSLKNKVGLGLKFGKHAIISSLRDIATKNKIDADFIFNKSEKILFERISKWKKFETEIKKKQKNRIYLDGRAFNFANYYKGKTINNDIKVFFKLNTKN